MNYQPVIGLEVHAELLTNSKMFCGCAVVDSTQAPPNTTVCPVCAGLPGTLPVLNARAVEFALQVALALQCHIPPLSVFARKNYFYPDLPKGYQISQYELPLGVNGWLEIETPSGPQRVRIRRVHLEEDTGKLTHVAATAHAREHSRVDLNRAGVPLLEIVTEPDLHSPEAVKAYAETLRHLLRYLGVNSGDMEKGVIRFEPNVSVRPEGSAELRTRTELKNLNSFRALERGVAYEIARQTEVWEGGDVVLQETRGWNEHAEVSLPQRGKEHAHDYRYFPEPDLPPLAVEAAWVEQLRAALPELPAAKRARFQADYGLSAYDAALLTEDRPTADYFEAVVQCQSPATRNPKAIANWMTGELFRLMKERGQTIEQVKITPAQLATLIALVAEGQLNLTGAKVVFEDMFDTGRAPQAIAAERGLAQVHDADIIQHTVEEVLAAYPEQLANYLAGKTTLEQWFFGQAMKRLQGRGQPQALRAALQAALSSAKQM